MSDPSQKTTVYLNSAEYRQLKGLAYRRGCAPAALVREAVAEYVTRHAPRRFPKSIGLGRSETGDLSTNTDAYLAGMGEDGLEPKSKVPGRKPAKRRKPR